MNLLLGGPFALFFNFKRKKNVFNSFALNDAQDKSHHQQNGEKFPIKEDKKANEL